MEGGELPHASQNATTFNNTARLRQSIHQLLLQEFNPTDFKLQVRIGGGEKNAKNLFAKALAANQDSILLVDVYQDKTKAAKLQYLAIEKEKNQVFFMEREMEAWILSQCACIEACAKSEAWTREKVGQTLEEDSGIAGKQISEINKPSDVLKTLLGRYYSKLNKKKKKAKQKYGKLKHAPIMIENLNLNQLRQNFTDVERLVQYIKNKQ